jgi:hypothetical protein
MAGTGGTSSTSEFGEYSRALCFGVGNLDVDGPSKSLDIDPTEPLAEEPLPVESSDRAELWDFRFISGVAREEEGVEPFCGSINGEGGPWDVGESGDRPEDMGIGGACRVDNRFNRRASVGLIVRAPSPVACGGMVERRLLEFEFGVIIL